MEEKPVSDPGVVRPDSALLRAAATAVEAARGLPSDRERYGACGRTGRLMQRTEAGR
jgi:hypothetical protein